MSDLVMGIAGVPPKSFDLFWRARGKILLDSEVMLARSFRGPAYMSDDAAYFLKEFAKPLRNDHDNRLNRTKFVLLYISSHGQSVAFSEQFFPMVMTVPINWREEGYSRTVLGQRVNDLVLKLRTAAQRARKSLNVLQKEMVEQDNKTSLLLPFQNFTSKVLKGHLQEIRDAIDSPDFSTALRSSKTEFQRRHPLTRNDGEMRRHFCDDRGIQFHPPGGARHAFAHADYQGHPERCFLASRLRLGARYDKAFHYDCRKHRGNVRAEFFGCHEPPSRREGAYLNIAPNDFVRG